MKQQFIKLLEAVIKNAGADLHDVWQRLPPQEMQWLAEDENAPEWKVFFDWIQQPDFLSYPVVTNGRFPEPTCLGCAHATHDFVWLCEKNQRKAIPQKVLGKGCKFWEINQ